jgi:hypothetical protein
LKTGESTLDEPTNGTTSNANGGLSAQDDAKPVGMHTGVLEVKLKLSGHGLGGPNDKKIFLILRQRHKEVARTDDVYQGQQWNQIELKLLRDFVVCVQCWMSGLSGESCLIGEAKAVRVQDLLEQGTELQLEHNGEPRGTIRIRAASSAHHTTPEMQSVVCMLQEQIFHAEGGNTANGSSSNKPEGLVNSTDYARFHLFRVHCLDQRLGVKYTTVNEGGTAILDKHFRAKIGITYFEAGQSLTYFDIEIPNDDAWYVVCEIYICIYICTYIYTHTYIYICI